MAEGTDPLFNNVRTNENIPIVDGIPDGAITTDKIADNAIDYDKLAVAIQNRLSYGVFHVNRNGVNQTGLNDDANNIAIFTTKVFDPSNAYSLVDNRYQPTIAGIYSITVSIHTTRSTTDASLALLFKNGVVITAGTYDYSEVVVGDQTVTILTFLVEMNGATDFLQGGLYIAPGETVLIGDVISTYMHGHLVWTDLAA